MQLIITCKIKLKKEFFYIKGFFYTYSSFDFLSPAEKRRRWSRSLTSSKPSVVFFAALIVSTKVEKME